MLHMDPPNVALMDDPPRDVNCLFQAIYDIKKDLLPLPLLIHNNDNNTVADIGPMYADAPLEDIQQETLDIFQMNIIIFKKRQLHT